MTSGRPAAPLPGELAAPLEKLVYLYVRESDGASVYDLRDGLGVPQLRLYPTIEALARRELVERDGDDVRPADLAVRAPGASAERSLAVD